ncbi:MAG: ABC transporter permease [Calditrichaeota bacterium]|nr:ABC transporter permease [Calditrichota bacterium]MCB9368833.1 ABC transporter permease [Calditrichota bacterium]
MIGFSRAGFSRWWSMVVKEFLQIKRDRLTFGMIVMIPLAQLTLFGYAINSDPKHMPTGLLVQDHSDITRTILSTLKHSEYFDIIGTFQDEASAQAALAKGEVQFVINIPVNFTRDVLRGDRPAILVEADATDPSATSIALAAVASVTEYVARKDLKGPLTRLAGSPAPFEARVHRQYNPEGNTHYNIVPGLMGVILTMMMILMTGLAMTRERERGTMENLLAMPVKPLEVMAGKILPYIFIGVLQSTIILLGALFLFHVPFFGSLFTLYVSILLFVAVNLMVGITLSSIAKNQLQAMQMTMFYFLPNILLSGFMFPFRGMPEWAQVIGNALPLTYFLRLVRGIFLKGSTLPTLWPDIWPLILFAFLLMTIAVTFYRRTLD